MRKRFVLFVVGGVVVATTVLAASADAAKPKTFHFTRDPQWSPDFHDQAVFKIHDSRVSGNA